MCVEEKGKIHVTDDGDNVVHNNNGSRSVKLDSLGVSVGSTTTRKWSPAAREGSKATLNDKQVTADGVY